MAWVCWGEGPPAVLRFLKADMKGFGVTEEATSEKFRVLLQSTELDTVTSTSSSFCDCPTAVGQQKSRNSETKLTQFISKSLSKEKQLIK